MSRTQLYDITISIIKTNRNVVYEEFAEAQKLQNYKDFCLIRKLNI